MTLRARVFYTWYEDSIYNFGIFVSSTYGIIYGVFFLSSKIDIFGCIPHFSACHVGMVRLRPIMLFFPFFYALFFWKAYATKVNYAHHLCSFFIDMPPSMLRFGGGIMLQMPFYAIISCLFLVVIPRPC